MKRFYKEASVAKDERGFAVMLDGKTIKTPDKSVLMATNENLAHLCAGEWNAQEKHILPDTMPLTQLLNTKIDRISKERKTMEKLVLNYIDTDLLCYRTDEPEEIAKVQNDLWQPWVDWFENAYSERFEITKGLGALKQPPAIHEKISAAVGAYDDDHFTIFQMLVPTTGSVILALAFINQDAGVDDLICCAFAEEDYKFILYSEHIHGGDPLTEKKKVSLRRDLEAAKSYLDTLV